MARKRELLIKQGTAMTTVAPSIKLNGAMVKIKKGWQKINGVMVPIFDADPLGPETTPLTFQAFTGRDSASAGGTPRIGYHGFRRYAGTVRNDDPIGYLITTNASRVLSATIGRVLISTGGGQGSSQFDTLTIMLNDRTVNPDGSTTVNWAVKRLRVVFERSGGNDVQLEMFEIAENATREVATTNPNAPPKIGILNLPVPTEFMPYAAEGKLTLELNYEQ